VTRRVFAIYVPLNLTRFGWVGLLSDAFCLDNDSVCGIVCTKSWNIEILSKPSRMGIKMWEVCFFSFFSQKMDESDFI
jgi:hypothetical protein